MIALNEDAKDIVLSNYEGNSLESVINDVTNKLIEKGYAQDKLVILVGTSGTITSDEVKDLIDKKLTTNNIDYSVIFPKISDTSSKLAKEYNITESKAAYLEEVIKNNSNLKIEDIKDMSMILLIKLMKQLKIILMTISKILVKVLITVADMVVYLNAIMLGLP